MTTSLPLQWTLSNAEIALDASMPGIVCVLMGMVTAVFGGVLRDIVCNEIPRAFSDHRPYAVCAFAGGWVVVGCEAAALDHSLALLAGAATATGLRVLAVLTGFTLPAWASGEAPRR